MSILILKTPDKHTCHWPGCKIEVPPKLWGCKTHWYRLPASLRAKILHYYKPGQEITKTTSREYLAAAKEVQEWIILNTKVDGIVKLL